MHSLTFFVAPDYEHDHLATRHEFYGIVAAIENPNVDGDEEPIRSTIRSLLEYHTIPQHLHIRDEPATASYPTRLAMSNSEDAWQRLKIEQRKHTASPSMVAASYGSPSVQRTVSEISNSNQEPH